MTSGQEMEYVTPAKVEFERKMRREIANSNERRRMQNINAGFETLHAILPVCNSGAKLSKAAILRHTADYIQDLEKDNIYLHQQNSGLRKLLAESDRSEYLDKFRSPAKRKLQIYHVASKVRKLDIALDDCCSDNTEIELVKRQVLDLQCQLDRERRIRKLLEEEKQIWDGRLESTPINKDDPSTSKSARRSLDAIIEAINQLEGQGNLSDSMSSPDSTISLGSDGMEDISGSLG